MKQLSTKQRNEISNLFQQGQRAVQLSLYDQAAIHFSSILKLDPTLVEARAFLAFVFSATKQHAKATQELRLLLKSGRNLAQTHFNLGNSLFEQALFDEAIVHFQSALTIEPTRVDALIHIGIAYRMLKNYDAAIQNLHQALNQDKKNARAFHFLGLIYKDIKDYPRALECLENATGLAPTEPQYRISFAETLSKAGLDLEAGIEFHKSCEMSPNNAYSFIEYGKFLLEHHRHDEALECFQYAKSLDSNNAHVYDKLGDTYTGLGNIELALEYYDHALTIDANRMSALLGKGQAFLEAGNSAEVTAIANKIIAIKPSMPHGYLLHSSAKKSKMDDGLTKRLIEFSQNHTLDTDDQIALHFALGKLFDDQNSFKEAFNHYAEGNRLKNAELAFSATADEARFSHLINYFDADFFARQQHLGTDLNLPVIIVGMPRSSTTLTEQIIASHPKILAAGEVIFWGKASTALPLRIGSQLTYPECIAEISTAQAKDIGLMYESTLRKISGANGDISHVTDKMPHNFMNLGLIALLFPKVKIIHTKRNPIDTCLSIFFQHFNESHPYAFDLKNLGLHYKQYERIMRHWHEVLPGRIMDIHYEDTISDPEYWSRKLIEHVGLEWDDACLAPHKLERTVKTASHWQVRQPIYKTSVQRWKNYEEFLGPLIEALKD